MKNRKYFFIGFQIPQENDLPVAPTYMTKLVCANTRQGAIKAIKEKYPKAENIQDSTIYTPC